ncbi:MAG: TonB-dependent receptor [Vicinamibacterales bacterium]
MFIVRPLARCIRIAVLLVATVATPLFAQPAQLTGTVTDETGGALPGVEVRARFDDGVQEAATTDVAGRFALVAHPGRAQLTFMLPNFGTVRREVVVPPSGGVRADAVMHFVLNADVTVTGQRTFTNLADAANPAENLVGIAQSASQGAITARQLEVRPIMRPAEVLETVPGVIASQHAGEGKANQYYLRGFNLDHGTDFATTVAGVPVNLPTHAHGHGYTDLNFLIPELISGVQYSKGPYFAEQGDFATAGAANISYASRLERPLLELSGGQLGYARALAAGSVTRGNASTLGAVELEHSNGPWIRPDAFRKLNLVGRYTRGDAVSGFSLTGMAYTSRWNSTDQVPRRAVDSGALSRFGSLDTSNGGSTTRVSGAAEWQRTSGNSLWKLSAWGLGYRLSLFSNFTYFLDDPVNGDQFRQADRRVAGGARLTNRRITQWGDRTVQHVFGVQTRGDRISLWLDHTRARAILHGVRRDDVAQGSVGAFGETSVEWSRWLRSTVGLRLDGYRFGVTAISEPANGGVSRAGIVSPKLGVVIGPFTGTEFYVNAGRGFHSNDARGSTIRIDPLTGEAADRVTPLAPATGAEIGVRTVAIPHLQSSLTLWGLGLDSELIFIGDAGTTEAGRPSRRRGIEFANYYRPVNWLVVDTNLAWSRARFRDDAEEGNAIPGSVGTVLAAGVTVLDVHRVSGSLRLRHFGPRPLVEDDSVRSSATTLLNAELGFRWSSRLRFSLDGLNLLNTRASDIDYYYTSRLPGEAAAGADDRHFHPAIPRTFRLRMHVGL